LTPNGAAGKKELPLTRHCDGEKVKQMKVRQSRPVCCGRRVFLWRRRGGVTAVDTRCQSQALVDLAANGGGKWRRLR
jgi:hypothetical protein